MDRRLWLLVAFAITGAACSAGGGGGSNITTRDPVTEEDAGSANGGANGNNGGANGSASGANDGAPNTGGTANGGTNGPEICEEVTVRADKVIPDILIVLDKSGSMVDGVDRWAPSVAALKTTTAELQDRVRFGLMIFPGADIPGSGGLFGTPPKNCQPGSVLVAPVLGSAADIAAQLDAAMPDGTSTPIPGALKTAHDSLGTAIAGPDKSPTPKYVLLVTDGGPNCTVDARSATLLSPESFFVECQMQSYAEVDSLAKDGIKTYVIGYDTQTVPALIPILDEMAKRGDTGETTHRVVTDENSLLAAIDAIAGQLTTCTFQLDQAPPDVNKIRVTLDGVDRANGDGWELTGDRTIELRGQACEQIQDISIQHTLSINVECKDVIIQ